MKPEQHSPDQSHRIAQAELLLRRAKGRADHLGIAHEELEETSGRLYSMRATPTRHPYFDLMKYRASVSRKEVNKGKERAHSVDAVALSCLIAVGSKETSVYHLILLRGSPGYSPRRENDHRRLKAS